MSSCIGVSGAGSRNLVNIGGQGDGHRESLCLEGAGFNAFSACTQAQTRQLEQVEGDERLQLDSPQSTTSHEQQTFLSLDSLGQVEVDFRGARQKRTATHVAACRT